MRGSSRVLASVLAALTIFALYQRIKNTETQKYLNGDVVERPRSSIRADNHQPMYDIYKTANEIPADLEKNQPLVSFEDITITLRCLDEIFENVRSTHSKFQDQWKSYSKYVQICSNSLLSKLPVTILKNKDEEKYFVKPIDKNDPLRVVTLGIGKDVKAEKQLKGLYPQTTFFGVDLDEVDSGRMYKQELGGEFLKGLVGAQEGTYKASIFRFEGKRGGKNDYTNHDLQHYSFKQVLNSFRINDTIDFLLMDIEGDEFALFPEIAFNPENYPVICQIDVEFHDATQYNETGLNIINVFSQVTSNGRYLYIHDTPLSVFHRSYFVNVMDQYCLKKFFGL